MPIAGQVYATSTPSNEGAITHPTTTNTRADVCIPDATDDVYTTAQLLDPVNAHLLSSAAACRVIDMSFQSRVRFAARASTGYTAVSASPAIWVFAIDAISYNPTTGEFEGVRSVERIDSATQAGAATALTFNASPSTSNSLSFDGKWITPYTDAMDAKGRRFVLALLATKFAGTGSGDVDIIAEATN